MRTRGERWAPSAVIKTTPQVSVHMGAGEMDGTKSKVIPHASSMNTLPTQHLAQHPSTPPRVESFSSQPIQVPDAHLSISPVAY